MSTMYGKPCWKYLLAGLLGLGFALLAACTSTTRAGEVPRLHIAYGPSSSQFGELSLPPPAAQGQKKRYPVAVLLHGGCWYVHYDLDYLHTLAERLTDLGFATWSIEYRRLGETGGGWPGTFQDVGAGMDYLRVLSERYPLDIHNIVVLGHSAGGQLALWLASRGAAEIGSELYRVNPLLPAAIVGLAPITDIAQFAKGTSKCNAAAASLIGSTPQLFPARYRALALAVPATTRVFLLHGSDDKIVSSDVSSAFVNARIQRGQHAFFKLEPQINHFDIVDPQATSWVTLRSILQAMAP